MAVDMLTAPLILKFKKIVYSGVQPICQDYRANISDRKIYHISHWGGAYWVSYYLDGEQCIELFREKTLRKSKERCQAHFEKEADDEQNK